LWAALGATAPTDERHGDPKAVAPTCYIAFPRRIFHVDSNMPQAHVQAHPLGIVGMPVAHDRDLRLM